MSEVSWISKKCIIIFQNEFFYTIFFNQPNTLHLKHDEEKFTMKYFYYKINQECIESDFMTSWWLKINWKV